MNAARAATAAAYSALAVVLVATRTIGLDHSFWTDEIIAVEDFIRAGPGTILSGPDLSHEFYGIVAWATVEVIGESEIALRLWSVVPFVAGAALVTAWLHIRMGSFSGIVFLFLATVSPLLLDITRQARGYGIAFLAMAVIVVAALEAHRTGRTAYLVTFCTGGLLGTTTLPQFGIAFTAMGLALLLVRTLRWRAGIGVVLTLLGVAAWYAPHLGQVREASRIEDGVRIDALWLPTAFIDQVLVPSLIWIDGTALVAGVVWLPVVTLAMVLIVASPLARNWTTALVLVGPPVATMIVLWAAQAYVIPRYLSYLLVPLYVLLATGMAALAARWTSRWPAAIVVAGVVVVALLAGRFAILAPDVMRLPREANRDAARAVLDREPPPIPVLALMRNPRNLEHYLGRSTAKPPSKDLARRVCANERPVAYVMQPFGVPRIVVPCLARRGVDHLRFEQYARGGELNVWFVPPARP